MLVAALDLTVIAPILPAMLTDLQINTAEADRYVWVVSGYLIAYTLTIPILGRLSDSIGRRPVFVAALVVFLAGSVICALADSLPTLIAGRAIQGFGGGAMVPVSMALVGDLLPPGRRAAALGIVAAVDTLGWVLGPIWGAVLQQVFDSWRAVFLFNIPIGIVAGLVLVFAWRTPRPAKAAKPKRPPRPDLLGALFLSITLLAVNLAFSASSEPVGGNGQRALGASTNPFAEYQIPLMILGMASFIALIFVERRAERPLIPLGIFSRRSFSAANTSNALIGVSLMVAMVNVPLLVTLLETEERASIVSAQLLSAFSLSMAAGSLIGGRATGRFGYRSVTWVGLLVAAIGLWRMSGWPNATDFARMVPDLIVAGTGFGVVIAPIGAAAINAARREDLGIASGLVIVMRLLGMTLGISALTGWAVRRLNDALTNLPPVVQQPGETFAAYLERQQQFAADHAIPLTLSIVRDTFWVAAIVLLIAALPAYLLGRRSSADDATSS